MTFDYHDKRKLLLLKSSRISDNFPDFRYFLVTGACDTLYQKTFISLLVLKRLLSLLVLLQLPCQWHSIFPLRSSFAQKPKYFCTCQSTFDMSNNEKWSTSKTADAFFRKKKWSLLREVNALFTWANFPRHLTVFVIF